jgi:formiminotetrahydrofolate cyclodeaminase
VSRQLDSDEVLGSFAELVAEGTPAPGGGSVAAHSGMIAASLGQMICNITIGKPRFAEREPRLKEIRGELQNLAGLLRALISEDARSFEGVLEAYRMPKETDDQKAARAAKIDDATWRAANVPLETAERSAEVSRLLGEVAELGNPNALSDAAVGARMAEVAIRGASYNVVVNLNSVSNQEKASEVRGQLKSMIEEAAAVSKRIEDKLMGEGR